MTHLLLPLYYHSTPSLIHKYTYNHQVEALFIHVCIIIVNYWKHRCIDLYIWLNLKWFRQVPKSIIFFFSFLIDCICYKQIKVKKKKMPLFCLSFFYSKWCTCTTNYDCSNSLSFHTGTTCIIFKWSLPI